MKNVTFISAGAGSGKTYSLTQRIVGMVKDGVCSADEIILTTFTRAAAAELREKVRSALCREGLFEAAAQIDNAAIGTIHSIGYQLVSRYWFLLGISADVRMMDDDDKDFYVSQSLASLAQEEDLDVFRRMVRELNITKKAEDSFWPVPNPDFWRADLKSIIDKVQNFCIDAEGLDKAREESKQTIRDILGSASDEPLDKVREAELACQYAQALADRGRQLSDPGTVPEKIEGFIHSFRTAIGRREGPCVCDFNALAKNVLNELRRPLKQACPDESGYFAALQEKMMADRRTIELLDAYIDTIFSLAGRWQEKYKRFKTERRLLDFNDVMSDFGTLLEHADVAEEMRSRYKVALVDEFQDCSPQQVRFFKRLSELMVQSVWVGDVKQAIYNFRGTDTSLILDTIREVEASQEDGNRLETLEKSWRSGAPIVSLVNSVFSKAFANTLCPSLVKLQMPTAEERGDAPAPASMEPRHWHLAVPQTKGCPPTLAARVKRLHDEEQMPYSDMALLCFTNEQVKKYANALLAAGIPYRLKGDNEGGAQDDIFDFLASVVSVAASALSSSLSQAMVAYYTETGYTAARILSDRLRYLAALESGDGEEPQSPWLDEVSLMRRIGQLRSVIANQSVAAAVETLLLELDAADLIRRIRPTADAYDYCRLFVDAAQKYEERCTTLCLGCSLLGFVSFVRQNGLCQMGDDNGVTIATYHKAKGLEWRCVILCNLEGMRFCAPEYCFCGVQVFRDGGQASLGLFPGFLYDMLPGAAKDRVKVHAKYEHLADAAWEENKRLMYVGMTRPKELLVTVTAKGERYSHGTDRLDAVTRPTYDGVPQEPMPAMTCADRSFTWFGHTFRYELIAHAEADAVAAAAEPDEFLALRVAAERTAYAPRDVQPSHAEPSERLRGVAVAGTFAERLKAHVIDGNDANADATLGNCIHHLMCIYRDDAGFAAVVPGIAASYGVTLDAERFMASARAFYAWLRDAYGAPVSVEREVPFRFCCDNGQIVNGEIDMIYRTAEGDVLIDYKTYSGVVGHLTDAENRFYAGKYSGQIAIYEEAMQRAGREVRDRLICYFSLGEVVRIVF